MDPEECWKDSMVGNQGCDIILRGTVKWRLAQNKLLQYDENLSGGSSEGRGVDLTNSK